MSGDASVKSFALAFRAHWFAAMSGGVSVPFAALAVFLDNKYAQLIFAALAFTAVWFAAYRIWKAERERVGELEEKLRPKVKVLAVHTSPIAGFHKFTRNFDLEILNDSAQELNNCLACVTDIRIEGDDAQTAYRRHLPLALLTTRNSDRDGGGPFHLRAGQNKKIPLCTREDGPHGSLQILYEKEQPYYAHSLASKQELEVDIKIYGAETPTDATLKLAINSTDELGSRLTT